MLTSNFANHKIYAEQYGMHGVSIARYSGGPYAAFSGPECTLLMPTAQLLKAYKNNQIDWSAYAKEYLMQLNCLNPEFIWDEIHRIAAQHYRAEQPNPVLLCVESAKTLDPSLKDARPCHRRLVAGWFENSLPGSVVPEWEKPKTHKGKIIQQPKQTNLFQFSDRPLFS